MIVKAILAWAGLRATPHFHDPRVHNAMVADAAMVSGVRIVARRSMEVARAIAANPEDGRGISARVDRLNEIMAQVAERAR